MQRSRLPRPAVVLAFVALVLALAGSAWAVSKAPKNSVVSKSVKNNTLKGRDVKAESLKGFDIKDGSLQGKELSGDSVGGEKIKDGSLRGVDVEADSLTGREVDESSLTGIDADTLDGLDASCGAGAQSFLGSCWETTSRSPSSWTAAAASCATAGGELPGPGPLRAFAGQAGITLAATDEWTDQLNEVTTLNAFTAITVSAAGGINFTAENDPKGYRCVLPLLG